MLTQFHVVSVDRNELKEKKYIQISLLLVPKGPIDNELVSVLLMAQHQIGDKLLSEPMMTPSTDAYMGYWASMS